MFERNLIIQRHDFLVNFSTSTEIINSIGFDFSIMVKYLEFIEGPRYNIGIEVIMNLSK